MTYAYPIIIKPQPDGYYLAEAPDLSGIVVGGDTLPELLKAASDACAMWLTDAEDNGESIPAPTNAPDLHTQPGEYSSIVAADTDMYRRLNSMRPVKKTVSLPESLATAAESRGAEPVKGASGRAAAASGHKAGLTMLYDDIAQGLREAIAYERGELDAPSVRLSFTFPKPPEWSADEIKRLRLSLPMTQRAFADFMGVSVKTVEAWESGRNHPSGCAARLMQVIASEGNPIELIAQS